MSATAGGGLRPWMLVPALGAAMVLAVFVLGLRAPGERERLPSALLGDPVPVFELPALRPGAPGLSDADLRAPGVKLVNIWASWCVPCRAEHPHLMALAAEGVTIHGLNYKDRDADALTFLDELGDPFSLIGADRSGRAGIEWGVYGVPETFVIDGAGRVRFKHVGPILDANRARLDAAIAQARGGG